MNEATVSAPFSDFFDELDPALTPFADELSSLVDRLELSAVEIFQTPLGTMVTASLIVKQPLVLALQGLPIALVVGDADEDDPIELTVLLEEQGYCEVANAGLALRLQLPFLHPVDNPNAPVEISLAGGIHVSTNEISLLDPDLSLSIPRSEIGATGIIIALDDLSPVLSADNVPDIAFYYGKDEDFRGIHAASSSIEFLPALFFAGQPGLRIEGSEILIGAQGLSCEILIEFALADDSGTLLTDSEVIGGLADGGFPFVLNWLQASIRDNLPRAFSANGYLRVPLLELDFSLTMGLAFNEQGWRYTSRLQSLAAGAINLAAGTVSYDEALFNGTLGNDEAAFSGLVAGLRIDLAPFLVEAGSVQLELARDPQRCRLLFHLTDVDLGPLGTVQTARLLIEQDHASDEILVQFETNLLWADLQQRLEFADLPDNFPLPPDDAEVGVVIHYDNGDWRFRFAATLRDVDALWAFLPETARPEVPQAALTLDMNYDHATDKFTGEGSITLRAGLPELPQFPGMSLLNISTGNDDGLIDLTIKGGFAEVNGSSSPYMSASIDNALTVEVDFPGMAQPSPPIFTRLTHIDFDLGADDQGDFAGGLTLQGEFLLRPLTPSDMGLPIPPPVAEKLAVLLRQIGISEFTGTASQSIRFSGERAQMNLICTFDDAGMEIDLFDLLIGAVGGLESIGGAEASEIDLDLEIGFRLQSIAIRLGSLDAAEGNDFSFELKVGLDVLGLSTDISLILSDEKLEFGFDRLPIPIALPQLPLARADLDALRDGSGQWDASIWQGTVEPGIDSTLATDNTLLMQARSDLEQLEANPVDGDDAYAQAVFELRFRTIPELQKRVFHNTGKKFLTGAVLAVHQLLGSLSSRASQGTYQGLVEVYQDAVDLSLGSLHFDTGLQFEISNAKFVLPFSDPSKIRVEGGASLTGFEPDHPLKPMEDLVFKLGLSSDAIYFTVEGGADPIPLPDFGRYPGNAVVFDRLIIGYGYSKNSLLIDFAGELQLSPALIEDVDTSSRLGVGVRLPSNSALKFKIDLIPIVLGEVDFLLPLIAFDINLRSENPPTAPVSDDCTPAWDGLQLVAPGVLRAGFKRARFSPFFGPLPAPNYLTAFDIEVGNEHIGFTLICDNYQVITPVLGTIPIPLLADSTPFFDQFCTNLRLAGFGINFDLRRPFPHPNPLMIFELMGFLSDPSLPIDPAGHLANVMWAELSNARITLPPAVLGMFPEQGRAIRRELNARINVGTVIALAQQLTGVLTDLQNRMAQTADDIGDLVDHITRNPPQILITELLNALPRELRRVELNGSFVGFEASAVFLLVSPDELRAPLLPAPDSTPPPDSTTPEPALRWVKVVEDTFNRNPLRGWRVVNYGLKKGLVGEWTISGGALVQKNNVGDNSAGRYGAMLIRETDPLNDVRISVDLQCADDDGIGVLFHVQGKDSFYRFRMTSAQKEWRLMRLKAGKSRVLHASKTAFDPGKLYRVRIETRSVPQRSVALPASFDIRNAGRASSTRRSRATTKTRYTTHIRVWVNNALWCDLADADLPLTEGQVGLDSWWSVGAQFDNFRVERAERNPFTLAQTDSRTLARTIVPLTSARDGAMLQATDAGVWIADDLAGFNDNDVLTAIPETSSPAVVVAARVSLLASQVYRFLGVMQADGYFHLLTAVDVEPLTLTIAGIEFGFPLNIHGRVTLEGRSAGADSWSRFQAELHGDWDVLPVPGGSLARLIVGSESQPASIVADSRQGFQLQGTGELQLFANQVRIEAQDSLIS